ncbi:MAG TPA: sporulation protein YtfJ [Acholeplasmataceae bacterium]|nr:sporulation protein YtfJ [Acholeplasmataceae bacterium]
MENQNPQSQISELFKISTTSLKEMVDVDTIVGETITLENEISIVPISKIKCTFATGGTDQGRSKGEGSPFGGATGGSITITPIAFLAAVKDDVKLLHLEDQTHILEKIIDQVPEAIDSLKDFFSKKPKVAKVEIVDSNE